MSAFDLFMLLPFIALGSAVVVSMCAIAVHRSHKLTAILALIGLASAAACLPVISERTPHMVGSLLVIDSYAVFYIGLIFGACFAVAAFSYSYLELHAGQHEEYYLLLLIAALGSAILVSSSHFVTLFLGVEVLSVSLYAMTAYLRHRQASTEAGVKYLILAAVSSAFILFGMALVYAETGSMKFIDMTSGSAVFGVRRLVFTAGLSMVLVGLGFKLALVPFHMWTPDVYQGAPAPVTAFIATVSKGGVFALVLRLFSMVDITRRSDLYLIVLIMAVASMFAGNLLALFQPNVKRILAYSSISHLGYLLVTLLAAGSLGMTAAAFYLTAYFVTMLGAFGVVSVLSTGERDADSFEDYRALAWRRPWLAGVFTAMMLSLAGIPLTAGFIAKFYVVAAGAGSALWLLVIVLVVNSAIGLFYYLRIILAVYAPSREGTPQQALGSWVTGTVLAALAVILLWLGVFPGSLIALIQKTARQFM
jgi:NADH-quinone oxidoreductase subunit N